MVKPATCKYHETDSILHLEPQPKSLGMRLLLLYVLMPQCLYLVIPVLFIITAMHGKLQYALMGLSSYLCWCIATGIMHCEFYLSDE